MAAIALQLRPQHIVLRNRSFVHLFSSSSGSNGGDENESPPPPSQSSSSMSSYFNDVKASLKQSPPSPRRLFESPLRGNPSSPRSSASLEEIQKNLSEFRRRSAPPSPGNAQSNSPSVTRMISFQELYKRNVTDKGEQGSNNQKSGNSFDAIRESLKQLKSNVGAQNQNERFRGGGGGSQRMGNKVIDPYSLKDFKDSLTSKPTPDHIRMRNSNVVRGGSETNLTSTFDEELKNVGGEALASKNELLKMYSYDELGVKLQKLRPVESNKEGQNWFSLKELNERLMKLRVIEEKESEESIVGVSFSELRRNLKKLEENNDGRTQRTSLQRLDILGHLGGTPSFMLQPPKEQLVEKFFHPDNMSSAEKLKLELKKVREEFKMSESDCGSSRVQVAQLTTKIKHLSSVLHKKDKHSRKGLQEMVQRRKKLLRYLRRTDWDSYCLCLSKLGLRDNPDYKN